MRTSIWVALPGKMKALTATDTSLPTAVLPVGFGEEGAALCHGVAGQERGGEDGRAQRNGLRQGGEGEERLFASRHIRNSPYRIMFRFGHQALSDRVQETRSPLWPLEEAR